MVSLLFWIVFVFVLGFVTGPILSVFILWRFFPAFTGRCVAFLKAEMRTWLGLDVPVVPVVVPAVPAVSTDSTTVSTVCNRCSNCSDVQGKLDNAEYNAKMYSNVLTQERQTNERKMKLNDELNAILWRVILSRPLPEKAADPTRQEEWDEVLGEQKKYWENNRLTPRVSV